MNNQFKYMANFLLSPEEATIVGVSALGGGLLQGGAYVGSNLAMGDEVNKQEAKKEVLANTAAGVSSGVGGYLITKALNKKMGIV